jgi:hypothetical protein
MACWLMDQLAGWPENVADSNPTHEAVAPYQNAKCALEGAFRIWPNGQ